MDVIIVCLVGIAIGCIISRIVFRDEPVGTIRVDTSDPDDGPYLFLVLTKDLDVISQKKNIVLKIDLTSHTPRK